MAIPKRNGACRDFGFYLAWRDSGDDEIILALDDDCRVYQGDFAQRVNLILSNQPRSIAHNRDTHINIIDFYKNVPENLFPRGFPYSARSHYSHCTFHAGEPREVKFSLGLWKGVFDVNAIDKLQGPQWSHPEADLHYESVIIEKGAFISVCSMNMHFRREVLPAVYQLPMHVEVMPGWVIDRYGDIWGGFILKTLMDLRGDAMAVGEPMIYHAKDGNYLRNIWQEHICHLVNDEFLELLAETKERIQPASYLEMMEVLTEEFRRVKERCSVILKRYLDHLVVTMTAWTVALRKSA